MFTILPVRIVQGFVEQHTNMNSPVFIAIKISLAQNHFRLRFQVELCDGTGSLQAYVEHKEAQMLLGMSGEKKLKMRKRKHH